MECGIAPAAGTLYDMPRILSTIPILPALDLAETLAFFNRLGFVTVHVFNDDYAITQRTGVEIHFWACEDRQIAENTACFVRVMNIDRLYYEFTRKGVQVSAPENKPWGEREFSIVDPNGNLLRFSEALEVA